MEVLARRGSLPAPLESLKIGKTLGRGGFAVVKSGSLKAADGSSFPVAVKVLHPEYSADSCPELRLFKDEAELMIQMDHRNVIMAYGLMKLRPQFPGLEGHTTPVYALILELMEGGSLASLMVKQLLAGVVPKYTFSQALGWVIDVARALQYLHTGGKDGFPRIHRDVKLENVLLTAGMRTAKLADFGLQRAISLQQQEQPMLVRRSQRPPPGAILPSQRTSSVGPSRLAADADRPSSRQPGSVSLGRGLQSSVHSHETPAGEPDARASSVDRPAGGDSNPLFFAVENNGLTPLVVPTSPSPSVLSPTAPAAQNPILAQASDTLAERADVGRRSVTMPQLDERSALPQVCDTGSARLEKTTALRATQSGASSAAGGDGGNGSNNHPLHQGGGSRKSSTFTSPTLDRQLSPSSRLGTPSRNGSVGPVGAAQIAVRPSPLGPTAARPLHYIPSRQGSVQEGRQAATDGLGPTSPVDGAPRTPEQLLGGGRAASVSDRAPSGVGEKRTTPITAAPSYYTALAVSVDCQGSALTGGDWRASAGRGGSPGDGARPSNASARDVLLNEVSEHGTAVLTSPMGVSTPPSGRVARRFSASRLVAGAPGPGMPVDMAPMSIGAAGAGATATASAAAGTTSRSRMQVLTLTDMNNNVQECLTPGSESTRTPSASCTLSQRPPQLMPPSRLKQPPSPVMCATVVTVRFAGDVATSGISTPRTPTETAMEDSDRLDGGQAAAARAWLRVPNRNSLDRVRGVSIKAAAAKNGGGSEGEGTDALSREAAGTAGASLPLPLSDLLHMRLGALQVSVRSVRSSVNGAAPQRGSGPASPRMAALVNGGDWPQGDCRRRSRTGSLPGKLTDKAKAQTADFEEVFSLTGRTGSLMYLAPEAYKNEPYNDKIDVYSLGILMYELFGRTSITYTHISTKLPAFSRMLCNPDEFAERVAAGYRPARTNQMAKMPPELWELIEAAWHQDPVQRPDIDILLEELEDLVEPLAASEAGGGRGLAAHACGCVIC